jgi:hypothetical protein
MKTENVFSKKLFFFLSKQVAVKLQSVMDESTGDWKKYKQNKMKTKIYYILTSTANNILFISFIDMS